MNGRLSTARRNVTVPRREVKEMKQSGVYEPRQNSNCGCAEHVALAERELSAFFRAVTELFGPEQAALSAEDWLRELMATDGLPSSAREWRSITAKVSAQLASQVNALALSISTEFMIA
jgi:hypothetical protein